VTSVEFYEVHGLPVRIGRAGVAIQTCSQWSSGKPEPFSALCVEKQGKRITEQQWRELIQVIKLGW
jgi:hypothetical protein